MDGQCLKNGFWMVLNGKKNESKYNEKFIKNYDEDNDKGYILEVEVITLEDLIIFIVIYNSYQKEWKLINAVSLYAIIIIRKTMLFT